MKSFLDFLNPALTPAQWISPVVHKLSPYVARHDQLSVPEDQLFPIRCARIAAKP